MMKRKNFTRFPVLKKLAIVPLILTFALLISEKKYAASDTIQGDLIIRGTVISGEDHRPLDKALIVIKDQSMGTITDKEGNYKISVSPNDKVLIFSKPGYKKEEVSIDNQKTINVSLTKNDDLSVSAQVEDDDSIVTVIVTQDTKTNTVRVEKIVPDTAMNQVMIKGKVVSAANNLPITGALVIVKGTTIGTMTDKNGDFRIRVTKKDHNLVVVDPNKKFKDKEINIEAEVTVNSNVNVNVEVPVEVKVELDPSEK
jgi:hypothetical protein